MKKVFFVVAVVCAMLLTSCSSHFYAASNSNLSKTEVLLSQKNFRVIGEAEGVTTETYVFGIGGLSEKAVKANAVGEMFKSAKLSGTQTIVNINVKSAVCGLPPFYWKVTNVATGTIIEFIE